MAPNIWNGSWKELSIADKSEGNGYVYPII